MWRQTWNKAEIIKLINIKLIKSEFLKLVVMVKKAPVNSTVRVLTNIKLWDKLLLWHGHGHTLATFVEKAGASQIIEKLCNSFKNNNQIINNNYFCCNKNCISHLATCCCLKLFGFKTTYIGEA